MAIIFISPKKRQQMIFWTTTILFTVVLVGGATVALLPELKNQLTLIPNQGIFIMPDLNINFAVVDSDKVKNLETFSIIQLDQSQVGRGDPFGSYYKINKPSVFKK